MKEYSDKSTLTVKYGLAKMLKGGVIMDVTNAEQAKIAEEAGAVAVMALERVPADIRREGGVARMASIEKIREIMQAVSIPVMAKVRIGHYAEADLEQELGIDFIDESEVLTPADDEHHINKWNYKVPFVCGARNLGEALRRISEGASMIRTKGEAGTGDVKEAISHMNTIRREIASLVGLNEIEMRAIKYQGNEQYKINIQQYSKNYPFLHRIKWCFGEDNDEYGSDERLESRLIQTVGLVKLNSYYLKKGILGMEDELTRLFRTEKMPIENLEFLIREGEENEEKLIDAIFKEYLQYKINTQNNKFTTSNETARHIKDDMDRKTERYAREYGVSIDLVRRVAQFCYDSKGFNTLPVVNFAAGGIATPADAMLMMRLGCDGIFVGSGIFKSKDPKKRAEAIVIATSQWEHPDYVMEKLEELGELGEEMRGTSHTELTPEQQMQRRGE